MRLSDAIANYILEQLKEMHGTAEIQRNELANAMGCVPSQINYVLTSRFTPEKGYRVESRRGGGGYIRIVRMGVNSPENLLSALLQRIGNSIDEDSAVAIIQNLLDRRLVTLNEARIMRAAVAKNALALPVSAKDVLRASVLSGMVRQVFQNAEEGK